MRWAALTVVILTACLGPPSGVGTGPEDAGGADGPPALQELLVDPSAADVPLGDTVQIEVVGVDAVGGRLEVADDVAWSSSDDEIATVDQEGLVTGAGAGQASITVALNGVTAAIAITVVVPDPPRELRYTSPVTWAAGALVEHAPVVAGGPVRSFAVTPSLPTGLQLDPATGVVSGRALLLTAPVDYVVTAENVAGSTTAILRVSIVCEIASAPPQGADAPDPDHVDANADGVDGMACGPVFVSASAPAGGDGTKDRPLRSIAAAIVLAASLSPVRDVYVGGGDYAGSIAVASGVSIHGGYDVPSFSRTGAATTRITGGAVAIDAVDVDVDTTLSELSVTAADAVLPGAPSIALRARDGAGVLALVSVALQAGRGARGADGARGVDGAFGLEGDDGMPGTENSTGPLCSQTPIPAPGAGGFGATLDGDGGRGGSPGLETGSGDDGEPGGAGAAFGAAGVFGEDGGRGGNGSPGGPGAEGGDGDGGAADSAGKDGQGGGDGDGGGGGGGGAGGSSATTCDAWGGAGGGGGAGGTGGAPGRGGGAGGASIALYIEATTVLLVDTGLTAGSGGGGGDGGRGGLGVLGGPGGLGGAPDFDGVSGQGGGGGAGGRGGDGGHGGGGGGGSSAAIWEAPGADVSALGGTTTLGLGGAPGGGPGFVGMPGTVAAVHVGAAL